MGMSQGASVPCPFWIAPPETATPAAFLGRGRKISWSTYATDSLRIQPLNESQADLFVAGQGALVPGLGVEPRFQPPKGRVLPLDDPGRTISFPCACGLPRLRAGGERSRRNLSGCDCQHLQVSEETLLFAGLAASRMARFCCSCGGHTTRYK
jgi:hypothetical protein